MTFRHPGREPRPHGPNLTTRRPPVNRSNNVLVASFDFPPRASTIEPAWCATRRSEPPAVGTTETRRTRRPSVNLRALRVSVVLEAWREARNETCHLSSSGGFINIALRYRRGHPFQPGRLRGGPGRHGHGGCPVVPGRSLSLRSRTAVSYTHLTLPTI